MIEISKVIFLDLDGTLLDTSKRHYRLYKDILDKKRLTGEVPVDKGRFWDMKRSGKKTRDILPKHLSRNFIADFEYEWLQKIEKKSYLQYDKPFPGTKNVLTCLKKGFNLVLVTLRSNRDNLHWELSRLGLNDYFKLIISGEGPKKDLIGDYLINNCIKDKCFIVGDTEEDIRTGLELNIPTISATYGIRSKGFLEQFNPDFYINTVKEMINPKFILNQ